MKLKIKSGDNVRVMAGDHKGEEGKVLAIFPNKNRAIVEGVNMISKHTKPSAQSPQGGIVKKEASIHISNLMLLEGGEVTKVGYKMEGDKKVRVSKKTDKAI
jgi:large subunit ribosomal protein L24